MMQKRCIENTELKIHNSIRNHKRLDVPEETVHRCLLEINSVIFDEEPNQKILLKDFLKLYYRNYKREASIEPDSHSYTYVYSSAYIDTYADTVPLCPIYVVLEADNYNLKKPLIFAPSYNTKHKIKIKNLSWFLSNYKRQTNNEIGTNDIMNAEIVDLQLRHGVINIRAAIHARLVQQPRQSNN